MRKLVFSILAVVAFARPSAAVPAFLDSPDVITVNTHATASTAVVRCGDGAVPVDHVDSAGSGVYRVHLVSAIGPDRIAQPTSVQIGDSTYPVYARDVLDAPVYYYDKGDLGETWAPTHTVFKVWSPVSTAVDVLLYSSASAPDARAVAMHRGRFGVWWADIPGNLDGRFYRYRFTSYGRQRTAPDIYAKAASPDLSRSMVVDLGRTDPGGWSTDVSPHPASPVDAVGYEIHIRDFTIDPSSGVPSRLRGTYAGITHAGGPFDHLKRLGVTHVQIMPFQSINPRDHGYNWGYETYLFDVPEPRYAVDPSRPASTLREVKSMVEGLHGAHIGVIMDVVYNHANPPSGDRSPFWCAVPYYYFRTGPDGALLNESGVGNAVDDDHPMVRKYIVDSLLYWTREYHIDGFRFDLLGMFEPSTVKAISDALHRVRPDIILYGEPWTGGGPDRFGKGSQRGLGVAVFNDDFRNTMRGDLDGSTAGFALGGDVDPANVRKSIRGAWDWTAAPTESINYVSIHDDMALWDKICKTIPGDEDRRSALRIAGAVVLLSQGVPVLEGGAEIGRTKQGNANSYNAGDAVNRFDWTRAADFQSISDYYAALIALRRDHPAFRCATADEVRRSLSFRPQSTLPKQTVAFVLDGAVRHDTWRRILVVFHGSTAASTMALPTGEWRVAVDGKSVGTENASVRGSIALAPLSTYVFYQR